MKIEIAYVFTCVAVKPLTSSGAASCLQKAQYIEYIAQMAIKTNKKKTKKRLKE